MAATPEVRGGQATRRGASCYTRRRACYTCCPFECVFLFSCLVVAGQNASPLLLARFREYGRPKHAPRSPAGTHTCAVVYTRAACVPRTQEGEKPPAAGIEIVVEMYKNKYIWCIYI